MGQAIVCQELCCGDDYEFPDEESPLIKALRTHRSFEDVGNDSSATSLQSTSRRYERTCSSDSVASNGSSCHDSFARRPTLLEAMSQHQQYSVGSNIEVKSSESSKWFTADIVQIRGDQYVVRYDGLDGLSRLMSIPCDHADIRIPGKHKMTLLMEIPSFDNAFEDDDLDSSFDQDEREEQESHVELKAESCCNNVSESTKT